MIPDEDIRNRLRKLGVNSEDIREIFVHASGPGGQKVNKTSSAVVLQHIPSGFSVKCQDGRSQVLNRRKAWALLLDKIENKRKQDFAKSVQLKEKKRRQNRRKPRSLKEKILENKHHLSDKKKLRKKVSLVNFNEE